MARGNVKWRSTFKSLNGTTCTINIYDPEWPSFIDPISVTAASDPFFFEEDESDDLLTDVLRYRTGYIRLVEQADSGMQNLTEIWPTSAFQRYVEVLYGSTVVFNGYIQMQNFSSELVPVPRVLEFPVISPLGLLEQKIFTGIIPPTSKTLGELLNTALVNEYIYVYFPKNYGYPNVVNMSMTISSMVVTPWNKDFHHSDNYDTQNMVMMGESYAFLIEAICKAFGWIAHDTPDALIFTCFDYQGDYVYFPVGHIGESGYGQTADIPATAVDLENYFTLADDQATETTLLPETGIEIEYEGDDDDKIISFDRTYIPTQDAIITMPSYASDPDEQNSLVNLVPVPLLNEFGLMSTFQFNSNDLLTVGQGCVAWNGKEGIMCAGVSYNSPHQLFWVRFYFKKRGTQSYRISYNMIGRQNGYLLQLAASGSDIDPYYIYCSLEISHTDYVQATFYYRHSTTYPQLPSTAVMFITDIKLEILQDDEPYAEYRYKPATDSDIVPATYNPQPAISASVDMPISLYRNTDRLIGNTVRTTKLTEYPYLFTPRKHLVSKFRYSSALTFPHVRLLNYLGKKWRIIAQRFDPWNDEYQLTMQSSSVLDND